MIALEILAFVILTIPTAYELWNERTGEKPKSKKWSMLVRIVIALGSTWVAAVFKNDDLVPDLIKSAVMSFAIFFLCFDYCIAAILIHRGIIETRESAFSYVGKSSRFDKFKLWVRIGPWGRFTVKMAVFVGALILYFT